MYPELGGDAWTSGIHIYAAEIAAADTRVHFPYWNLCIPAILHKEIGVVNRELIITADVRILFNINDLQPLG